MPGVRQLLAQVLGVSNVTEDQLMQEVQELKTDNRLAALTKEGHIAADLETQTAARKFLQHDPDTFERLMRTPRPVPAQGATTQFTPPSSPPAEADSTELAIRQEMEKSGKPYHEAAATVSAGASIVSPSAGGTA